MIRVEGYEEVSGDDGVVGTGGYVTEHGSAINGGATVMGGARSEKERRSNHGSNPERRVDQEDLFQESPNSEQVIMASAKITDVNVSREVNRMIVSTYLEADFQAQLEEIDKELNKFETIKGRAEVGPDSMQALGVDRLSQIGQQGVNVGPLDSKND